MLVFVVLVFFGKLVAFAVFQPRNACAKSAQWQTVLHLFEQLLALLGKCGQVLYPVSTWRIIPLSTPPEI